MNAKIGANLVISGANERERRPRSNDRKGKGKEDEEKKFVFNEDDFPEL